ncbi:hypothetical protein LY78DRAFT_231797 [Colletotrichum sublineola]|nr:hypothetical protein LY78DRAFT_231797 [Colletotrichum sublineola]
MLSEIEPMFSTSIIANWSVMLVISVMWQWTRPALSHIESTHKSSHLDNASNIMPGAVPAKMWDVGFSKRNRCKFLALYHLCLSWLKLRTFPIVLNPPRSPRMDYEASEYSRCYLVDAILLGLLSFKAIVAIQNGFQYLVTNEIVHDAASDVLLCWLGPCLASTSVDAFCIEQPSC